MVCLVLCRYSMYVEFGKFTGMRVDPPLGADKTKTANVYAHTRSSGFGHEVRKRILLGTYALTAE